MARYLIVNADDFGLCRSVNRGIIEASERGIVTSASLMVRQPAAAEAAAYARTAGGMSVGLHLDMGEWIFQEGQWRPRYQVVDANDPPAVQREVEQQLAEFRRLMGRDPTHLDSHQHVHRNEPIRSAALALARSLGIVLRSCHASVHYCGDFYGQDGESKAIPGAISTASLQRLFAGLPEGVTELCCHPGHVDDLESAYRVEREEEVRVLCDPAVRQELARQSIALGSFATLADLFKEC